MSRPFEVFRPQDKIALRRVLFAVELLDAVTLDRISHGMKEVKAHGLQGKPIVNQSGLFVWLDEVNEQLQHISIDPGVLPYEKTERSRAQLNLDRDITNRKWPLTSIELSPRLDYPFGSGITGLRGTLVEALNEDPPRRVSKAEVRLRWLDQDGAWQDAPTRSHTTAPSATTLGGDFVAILRFVPSDDPHLDATGNLRVRLCFKRGEDERISTDLKILQGRVADAPALNQSIFAWDELE